MTEQTPGGADPGTVDSLVRRRSVRLSGVLLGGIGLFDIISGSSMVGADPFVVMEEGGMYHVDVTGWFWTHLGIGLVTLAAGVLVLTGRVWAVFTGIAVALLGMVVDVLVLPYQPFHATLAIGAGLAAITLLLRRRVAPTAGVTDRADTPSS